MKTDNKISIITPSFNQGQFIEDTIQSILIQKYEYFEHIIIDGGSTDNTLGILKKYSHLNWISEEDKGQSEALNKGFKMAKSEWVLWLNADDILLPGAIRKYVDTIAKHPNADVIHGHMQFFMDGTNEITKRQYFNNFSRIKTIFGVVIPPTTGTLFNRKILLSNPLDINFHFMMDAEWFMRCGNFLNVVRMHDFLVRFRISDTNKTSMHILTGKVNEQQIKERKSLYDNYAMPLLRNLPKKIKKISFNFIRFFLININRLQKLKLYLG
jgi:glycosyltransferase involved in cell wall biosynthesis